MALICFINGKSANLLRPTPDQLDYTLNIYKASSYDEAALLLVSPQNCFVSLLNENSLDDSQWWQALKHANFERGVDELLVVTKTSYTNRWALDYRPSGLPQSANYVVNTEWNGFGNEIRPNFQFHQNSTSGNARQSLPQMLYTLLANYRRVRRRKIGLGGRWLVPFTAYFPL